MIVAVWAPLLLPFLAVPLARRVAEALSPRPAAWVLAGTAVTTAGATAVSLGLLAFTGLLRLPAVAALGHLAPHRLADASAYPAVAAALLLVAASALLLRTGHHQLTDLRRARSAADAGHTRSATGRLAATGRTSPADLSGLADLSDRAEHATAETTHAGALTVLDDDRADAFALPGPLARPADPGRIVVTTGMLRALTGPERAVLLAHEQAHLGARHHLFLAATEYATVLHPALRPLRAPLGFQLERWADEVAARVTGDRTLTARAVGRAALAAAGAPRPDRPRLAPAAHSGPVPRRVAALLTPPRPLHRTAGRTAAALALAACLALTASASLEAAADLHDNVEAAQAH
ncbi:M48 family metalloprotease [Kitasatospora sp. NPDC056138]|uniref:M48 family metalloprotease n=1 Tax=Kitasatospora sp. NPDC056138 TaxID=3345724 RepID=UPI0035D7A390